MLSQYVGFIELKLIKGAETLQLPRYKLGKKNYDLATIYFENSTYIQ